MIEPLCKEKEGVDDERKIYDVVSTKDIPRKRVRLSSNIEGKWKLWRKSWRKICDDRRKVVGERPVSKRLTEYFRSEESLGCNRDIL